MNKNPIVLSLFDGIGCGRVALERAGITPNRYFASEIKKQAIKCAKENCPDIIGYIFGQGWLFVKKTGQMPQQRSN